jgi:pheromone shutdown protein TraB
MVFFAVDTDVSIEMIQRWFLINGTLSAIGTAIAFGHPITIATAFVAAPFTSLNPAVAAGWVAGLVEAFLRKPQVRDFENLADDITHLRWFLAEQHHANIAGCDVCKLRQRHRYICRRFCHCISPLS